MLIPLFAHTGQPPAPHDLWSAWTLEPALLLGFVLAGLAYRRGRTRGRRRGADVWRARCFTGALVALGVALVSPLDAVAGALASAHMVQHVLLLLVAAPLLALSAPSSALLRGSPLPLRRAARWRRRLGLTPGILRALRHPIAVWLLHVATLWFWHAAVPYDAALDSDLLHVVEHASFLFTGLLFWRVVVGSRGGTGRVSHGFGVLLVFAMALQSVFLSALLTFAREPWYSGYAATTVPWGLDPLADQQLAGVVMWIPAGLVYLAVGLALMVAWVQATEREAQPPERWALGPLETKSTSAAARPPDSRA